MDIVENNLAEDKTISFNREKAKETASKVLNNIIPSKMTLSEASRLTNNDPGNLKRAKDGETLLNAKAFTMIVKKGYALRSVNEVEQHIYACPHLHSYLKKELGEEYTNPYFEPDSRAIRLLTAIDDNITRKIYGLLFTKKKIFTNELIDLFGRQEVEKSLNKLANQKIITIHETLGIIEMTEELSSSNFVFNKKNIALISDDLNQEILDSKKGIFSWDTVLLSEKQEYAIFQMFCEFRSTVLQKIREFEQEPIETRTKFVDYSVIYANSLDISGAQKENLQ